MYLNWFMWLPGTIHVLELIYVVTKNNTCTWIDLCGYQEQYMYLNWFMWLLRTIHVLELIYVVTKNNTCTWIDLCDYQEQYMYLNWFMWLPGTIHVLELIYVITKNNTCTWIDLCDYQEWLPRKIHELKLSCLLNHDFTYYFQFTTLLLYTCKHVSRLQMRKYC
jgi:hypothetical protein